MSEPVIPPASYEGTERNSATHDDSEPLSAPLLRACYFPGCREPVAAEPRFNKQGAPLPDPRTRFCVEHATAAKTWLADEDRDDRALQRQLLQTTMRGAGGGEDGAPKRATRGTRRVHGIGIQVDEWEREPDVFVRPVWWQQAACLGQGTTSWFPRREDARSTGSARLICRTCPVAAECVADAQEPAVMLAGTASW